MISSHPTQLSSNRRASSVTQVSARSTRIFRLSHDALRYGALLAGEGARSLASRLYLYNAVPCTPALQRRFDTQDAVVTFLLTKTDPAIARQWHCERSRGGAWLMWSHGDKPSAELHFKLYISPSIACLPEAFSQVASVLSMTDTGQFKTGADAFGLVRSDKMIAYFESKQQLEQAAAALLPQLDGLCAHGVPFTASLDPPGVLSWARDPSRLPFVNSSYSWRQWLTIRLSDHLSGCPDRGVDKRIKFALNGLCLDGVDVKRWRSAQLDDLSWHHLNRMS